MKLLLDTHHSPRAAERLRDEGYDVTAAAEDRLLATLSDEELLREAARDGRALVTENARDFDRIVRSWAAAGEHHAGVVFTSPRRYTVAAAATPRSSSPPCTHSWLIHRRLNLTGCSGYPDRTLSRVQGR